MSSRIESEDLDDCMLERDVDSPCMCLRDVFEGSSRNEECKITKADDEEIIY